MPLVPLLSLPQAARRAAVRLFPHEWASAAESQEDRGLKRAELGPSQWDVPKLPRDVHAARLRQISDREAYLNIMLDRATNIICELIAGGQLRAFLTFGDGEQVEVPEAVWEHTSIWSSDLARPIQLLWPDGTSFEGDLTVALTDLDKALDQRSDTRSGVEPSQTLALGSKRARVGRPPKKAWDDVWFEICKMIYLGEYGSSLSEFGALLLDRCLQIPDPPDKESIERVAARVWRDLIDPRR